jgi:hypothetical protein
LVQYGLTYMAKQENSHRASERIKNLKNSINIVLALCMMYLASPQAAARAEAQSDFSPEKSGLLETESGKNWEKFKPGDQVFAQATRRIESLFTAPSIDAKRLPNKLVHDYGDELSKQINIFKERYEVNQGTMLRVRKIDQEWAQVLLENDIYSPFELEKSSNLYPGPLYIQTKDFEPVVDLEPFSVLAETTKQQKQIIVFVQPNPELLLLEGDQIVMRIPVGLGGKDTPTPLGDFRIYSLRLSNHMPGFIGIPYAMEFHEGINIHGSYYYDWKNIKKGFFQSGGCINALTPDSPLAPSINGQKVGADRFIFQWLLTNYPNYDTKNQERVFVPWNDRENTGSRMPVRIMDSIANLKYKSKDGRLTSWDAVITRYQELLSQDKWISPNVEIR